MKTSFQSRLCRDADKHLANSIRDYRHAAASPFVIQWIANAKAFAKEEKARGTVSIGGDCLFRCVRIPSHLLQGAPQGTNARYVARELFTREVIPALGRFVQ